MSLSNFGGTSGGPGPGATPGGPASGSLGGTYPAPSVLGIDGAAGVGFLKARALNWTSDGTDHHGALSVEDFAVAGSASPVVLASFTQPANSLWVYSFRVAMRNPATNDCFAVSISAAFKRVASANPVAVGTPPIPAPMNDAGASAWTATLAINGAAIELRSTSATGVKTSFEGAILRVGPTP